MPPGRPGNQALGRITLADLGADVMEGARASWHVVGFMERWRDSYREIYFL